MTSRLGHWVRATVLRRVRAAVLRREEGQALVITALALTAIIAVASYGIDTGIWYVHRRHLQTQTDAAALAASQTYQFNCGAAGDAAIANVVHQYDGTGLGLTTAAYNPQTAKQPTPSSTSGSGHLEYSKINSNTFQGSSGAQTTPGSTGLTGSPCTDGVIDVKMTEQGLPSYLIPGIGPAYLNTEAEVGFQTASQTAGGLPFVEPIPTPSSVAAEFVDEANGDVLTTPGVVTLASSNSGLTWSATGVNINFADPTNGSTTDTFPVGMRVAFNPTGGAATFPCSSPEVCYDNSSTSNLGVTFTRAWANSGNPGTPTSTPVAPQASDVWLQACTTSGSSCTSCPSTPGAATSNFFASSASTSEQLCANMTFTGTGGTSLSCSTASLTVKAGGTAVTMNCPTGGPNGTWSSGPLTVPAYSPPSTNNGVMNVTMSWSVTAGNLPVGAAGGTGTPTACTSGKPCTGSFDGNTAASPETVQQAYSGAYSLSAGLSIAAGGLGPSNSGTISSAAVTNSTGNELQSIQNGTNSTNDIITVNFYGFESEGTVGGAPFELTLGGNQGNGDLGCNGNGVPQFQQAIESGCPGTYASTSVQPASAACSGSPTPAVCVNTNPGGGKSKNIADALNTKINGSQNAPCTSPNYWTSPNSVGQILDQQLNGADDPRLVTLFYTDNQTLPNGSTNIPIRGFAEFYITGWGGADPCLPASAGGSGTTGTNGTSGLAYTTDTLPPDDSDGVIMGHFVTYINPSGAGSGTKCVEGTLAICVPVLTK